MEFKIPFTREAWLVAAVKALDPIFSEQGFLLPKVRVSCAFPSTSRRSSVVGQCWGTSCSADGINEIFQQVRTSQSDDHVFQIACSYMEIYGRELRDLLNPKGKEKLNIKLAQHTDSGLVEVEGGIVRGQSGRWIRLASVSAP